MHRRPPHIVVTTPESLYILLGSESGRRMLATTRTVIVDEIHALAPNKRGAHLALSLERLAALCGDRLLRVGLSATQKPIEAVARFLVGGDAPDDECTIIDAGHRRARDLALELPASPLEAVMSGEVWQQVYDQLTRLIEGHRTTLIFVNTRRLAERVTRQLARAPGPGPGSRAPRQPRQGTAAGRGAASQARRAEGAGGDCLARARDRHRRGRPGLPDRLAALDREFPAACRALGARDRWRAQGQTVPALARRARRMRGAARQRAARRARPADDPRTAPRCARAADRRRGRRARMGRGRSLRPDTPGVAVSRARAPGFRGRGGDAGRGLQHPARPPGRRLSITTRSTACCAAGAVRGSPR